MNNSLIGWSFLIRSTCHFVSIANNKFPRLESTGAYTDNTCRFCFPLQRIVRYGLVSYVPKPPVFDTSIRLCSLFRLETGICGAIIRPYHDATRSSKITIITQVRGSIPSPLKSTFLTGNPSKWLIWLKKHHDTRAKDIVEKENEDDSNKDEASSVSSRSEKQD